MQDRWPRHLEEWKNAVEHKLQQIATEFDRAWRFLPQVPDPEIGISLQGPLSPVPFNWSITNTSGGTNTGGTPNTGGTNTGGTIPFSGAVPVNCDGVRCYRRYTVVASGFTAPWTSLNGTTTVERVSDVGCDWNSNADPASPPWTLSPFGVPALTYWALTFGPVEGLSDDPCNGTINFASFTESGVGPISGSVTLTPLSD